MRVFAIKFSLDDLLQIHCGIIRDTVQRDNSLHRSKQSVHISHGKNMPGRINRQLDDDCQMQLMDLTTQLIPLGDGNAFIYATRDQITTFCDNNMNSMDIQGEGILRLTAGCTLEHDKREFSVGINYESTMRRAILPRIEHSDHFLDKQIWQHELTESSEYGHNNNLSRLQHYSERQSHWTT